jgi:hypothetical protein
VSLARIGVVVAAVGLLVGACSGTTTDAGGLEVILATDLPTPASFDAVQVQVSQQGTGGWQTLLLETRTIPDETRLPTTLSVAAGSSGSQEALIVVTALKSGAPVVVRTVEIQVPTSRVAELPMVLSASCVGKESACNAGSSCQPSNGQCGLDLVDPLSLQTYSPGDEATFDAGMLASAEAGDAQEPDALDVPDSPGAEDAPNVSDASGAADAATAPDASTVSDAAHVPDAANAPDAIAIPDAPAGIDSATCTASGACTPANACDLGGFSCVAGVATCVDQGASTAANGVSCGSDVVCARGACLSAEWAEWPMPNGQADVSSGAPNPQSLTDNQNGTVTDAVTGLMWQQGFGPSTYTWAQAPSYCTGLSLAGHTDWRLPTYVELFSLDDFSRSDPSINPTLFPDTPTDLFWSSTPLTGSPGEAWVVTLYYGGSDGNSTTNANDVRCVR